MDYNEAVRWLYEQLPTFHRLGAGAYKPGLSTTLALSEAFGNPHLGFKSIHIAGTNGKGSTAHTLAAILQESGYKVGLYTSPHLLDFRERIRVNGRMIPESKVTAFVNEVAQKSMEASPSFFEMTTIMAFRHFADEQVDIAVIETGLGGRLDSTNIITPLLSVITNISFDHTDLLGDTRAAIAGEKAGIIKPGVPVVIGESDDEIRGVFEAKGAEMGAPVVFAEEYPSFTSASHDESTGAIHYLNTPYGDLTGELSGDCQLKNCATILTSVAQLISVGLTITPDAVREGFANVCELTGLMGRWMKVADNPLVMCDTGHNPGGWRHIIRQLKTYKGHKRLVIGFVNDKDVSSILDMIATISDCELILTKPDIPRGLALDELAKLAEARGLRAIKVDNVAEAYKKALSDSRQGDMVYVGGSTYVVAEFLAALSPEGAASVDDA